VLYTYQHYPASPAGQSGYDTEVVSIVGAVGAASDNVTAPAPGGRVRLEDGVDPYTGVLSWTGTETATAVIVKVTDGGYSGAAPLRAVLPGNTQQLDLISFVQAAGLEAFCWGLSEVIGVFQAEYSPDMEVDGRGANLVPRSGYLTELGRGSFDLDQIELRRMVREADYYTCEYGE